jgi:hypothetical protein
MTDKMATAHGWGLIDACGLTRASSHNTHVLPHVRPHVLAPCHNPLSQGSLSRGSSLLHPHSLQEYSRKLAS